MTESAHFKKGDGLLNLRIRDLEDDNAELQANLVRMQQDFKDLLSELESIKREMVTKDQQIQQFDTELRLRPNLGQMNAKKVQIEQLQKQVDALSA